MGRSRLRRYAPVFLVVAAAIWIIIVIVWITVSPVAGPGNPMD